MGGFTVYPALDIRALTLADAKARVAGTKGEVEAYARQNPAQAMGIAALFGNAFCLINNAFKSGKLIRSGTMEEVKGDDSLEEVFLELEDEKC